MERLIFHVDVNSAFLSWEAVRRIRNGESDLRLVPAVIGGDRDKRTGVVLAKSMPAKKFGIKTGEPIAMALRKCPTLVIAKPDFRLYVKNSRAFMDICRDFAPIVEAYSIDECFLDMSGTSIMYPDPVAAAHQLKDRIKRELGFTVNIGIGPNKILAKMAGDFEKPDKVHTLFQNEIPQKMWPLPVSELFSVGHATAEKLTKHGIRTIEDLAKLPLRNIQILAGNKFGEQLHRYANGIDDSPVRAEPEEAKGYSVSTTLEEDVKKREVAYQILLSLADSVTARIRADGAKARCISVYIRSFDFHNKSHQCRVAEPTDITEEVYKTACRLFDEAWDDRTPLRLLGIAMTDITREDSDQISLFTDAKKERARTIDKTVDSIRTRYGHAKLTRGTEMLSDQDVGKKYKAQTEE